MCRIQMYGSTPSDCQEIGNSKYYHILYTKQYRIDSTDSKTRVETGIILDIKKQMSAVSQNNNPTEAILCPSQ